TLGTVVDGEAQTPHGIGPDLPGLLLLLLDRDEIQNIVGPHLVLVLAVSRVVALARPIAVVESGCFTVADLAGAVRAEEQHGATPRREKHPVDQGRAVEV